MAPAAKGKVDVAARGIGTRPIAVAPLLVLLPLVAGSGPQDTTALGLLAAKATFGFGGVLWAGSYLLRAIYALVASARSTETFVAATLLVAVGMGQAAQESARTGQAVSL